MLMQTIRNTFRSWRRTPVLAVSALLTLSLGVGFNAAVFSVVRAVLFRPLPYPASERLVELFEVEPARGALRASVLNYVTWAERTTTLEALAAFNGVSFNVQDESHAERVNGAVVTASLFRVLAVAPLAGRSLGPDDERPGSRRVALISQSFWQRRYGAESIAHRSDGPTERGTLRDHRRCSGYVPRRRTVPCVLGGESADIRAACHRCGARESRQPRDASGRAVASRRLDRAGP